MFSKHFHISGGLWTAVNAKTSQKGVPVRTHMSRERDGQIASSSVPVYHQRGVIFSGEK